MSSSRDIFFSLLLGLVCLSSAEATQAAEVQTRHARVELISTQAGDVAGKEFLLGVHFVLEKGWHIYWRNPGDSGQPPSFSWILPAGSSAGEVQWPRPERLQSSATIADYGFRDDVLLMVPLHLSSPPGKSSDGEIGVDAKWLICREVCLPDHAHLTVSLASLPANSPLAARLFAKAKALLPEPWPKQWKVSAESGKEDFVLTIAAGKPLTSAEFFPLDPGQIDNAASQRVHPTAAGAKLVLKKSDLLLKPIAQLRGVLLTPGGGAYQLDAPVLAPSR